MQAGDIFVDVRCDLWVKPYDMFDLSSYLYICLNWNEIFIYVYVYLFLEK